MCFTVPVSDLLTVSVTQNYATAHAEVLIVRYVPPEAIVGVFEVRTQEFRFLRRQRSKFARWRAALTNNQKNFILGIEAESQRNFLVRRVRCSLRCTVFD
jgi:hypothetical protein